jgi:hypothetical protein
MLAASISANNRRRRRTEASEQPHVVITRAPLPELQRAFQLT